MLAFQNEKAYNINKIRAVMTAVFHSKNGNTDYTAKPGGVFPMKKILTGILAGVLALTATIGLTACGGGSDDPAMHSITYTENDNYRVIDLSAEGQTGSDILFDVLSESVFYEIGEVSYNGTPITKGSLGYKFTMPDEDVLIEIDLTPVTEYDDPDDYLSWGSNVIDEISVASEEDMGYTSLECTQKLSLVFDMAKFGSNNNVVETDDVLSSNQDVIPDEALSFDPFLASGIDSMAANTVLGGDIVVDLKQINPGTTTIYLHLDFNNASDATLMRTFTVTEYGEIEVETVDVAFEVINESKFDDLENITITFKDNNYIYGGPEIEYQSFTLDELTSGKGTFKYVDGHSYTISASHAIWNEEEQKYENSTTLDIWDWTEQGSSTSGFNQISDGALTLVTLPTTTNPVEITIED